MNALKYSFRRVAVALSLALLGAVQFFGLASQGSVLCFESDGRVLVEMASQNADCHAGEASGSHHCQDPLVPAAQVSSADCDNCNDVAITVAAESSKPKLVTLVLPVFDSGNNSLPQWRMPSWRQSKIAAKSLCNGTTDTLDRLNSVRLLI